MEQLIFFAERMPSDLSQVNFSEGFTVLGPDLAGLSLLIVVFAGLLALRLGTTLRDS